VAVCPPSIEGHTECFIGCSHNLQLLHGTDGRVIAKETQHFSRCVGPTRIGVGTRGTAARPSVSGSMDAPLLQDCPPVVVGMDRASIGMSTRYLSAMHLLLPVPAFHRTRDDIISVTGVHYGITIAVKNDGRDRRSVFENGRSLTAKLRRASRTAVAAWPQMRR
jgi:hypothetical protein